MTKEIEKYVSRRTLAFGEIRYYDHGRGVPLVLIHGMFGDFLDWEPVLETLSEACRVIAVDLPGFGESSKPRIEYSAELFTEALHDLFAQLEVKRVVLAGNSFGGQLAILYALRYPEMVAKLVLVNSGGFRKWTAEEIALTESRFTEQALGAVTPQINAILFANVFTRQTETSVRYLQKQNSKLERSDYPAYAYVVARSIHLSLTSFLTDRVGELRCPTLLVWGEQDPVLPLPQAEAALKCLQNGQLQTLPGCGHAPQLECPKEFMKNVIPFLNDAH
ncbi:MAG TPA: alpha/beta hydrolase [Verrucomicrobiae bacterium]|nr:alpha/beta hydrolase [Verrucomicrobiae bacterium]